MHIAETIVREHSMAAALILDVTYGIHVLSSNDPYIDIAEKAMHGFGVASIPGRFLVVSSFDFEPNQLPRLRPQNTIPVLKYVPTWFPGADFKRKAKEWKKSTRDLWDLPFAETKRDMVRDNPLQPRIH